MGNYDELRRKREAADAAAPAPAPRGPHDDQVDDIERRADDVADDFSEFEEAIMDERETAAKIIEVAITHLKPALGALVGKIETRRMSEMVRDGKGQLQSRQRGKVNYYPKRGVLVVNKFNVIEDVVDVEGAYGGSGLYALEHGAWAIAQRTGVWRRREGEQSLLELDVTSVSSSDVLQHFRVEAVLEGLVAVLKKQESLEDATQVVRRRTLLLRDGLSALLDGLRT